MISHAFPRFTDAYISQQKTLHARPEGYGGKGRKWAEAVCSLVHRVEARSVLDYGCGQGTLLRSVGIAFGDLVALRNYDPAIQEYADDPLPADLVVCTDVLEHIEPSCLTAVVGHLHVLTRKLIFLVVALDPANKTLSDGRNAHLIQESPAWWAERVKAGGFQILPDEVSKLPLPVAYQEPEKRAKRWIAVAVPR